MMKQSQILLVLFAFILLGGNYAKAQICYHNADNFPLLGRGVEATATRYDRLPDSLKSVVRAPLWQLSLNTAGMAIRFSSNSTTIAARWTARFDNVMNHMTPTGIKGLDLYCWENGKWRFVNSGRPSGKVNQFTIVSNMIPKEREYLLYLPLYDGITSLAIGVDSLSQISAPKKELIKREKPVVLYGTSILQGGCASRPGMASTNILSRQLNRQTINYGFSGNGLLDLEVAHCMAAIDAGAYVLDFLPNASVDQMNERAVTFYRILRERRPHAPIIFIEDPIFPHTYYDQRIAREVERKNETIRSIFKQLKQEGEKHIYLISSKKMLGDDAEATVDGIHFTDLGFVRYVDLVCPVVKKALK